MTRGGRRAYISSLRGPAPGTPARTADSSAFRPQPTPLTTLGINLHAVVSQPAGSTVLGFLLLRDMSRFISYCGR